MGHREAPVRAIAWNVTWCVNVKGYEESTGFVPEELRWMKVGRKSGELEETSPPRSFQNVRDSPELCKHSEINKKAIWSPSKTFLKHSKNLSREAC